MVELLAPARDMDCAKAAVYAGADAIYFGLKQFSARMSAGNFDIDGEAETLIDFCHLHSVKAFCAVNTLLDNKELAEALGHISKLYSYGVDAVIVQDLGLIKAVRDNFADLPVHASTQMGAHNVDAVLFLEKLGVSRVILSRELTLKEIKEIGVRARNIEIEVFVHGALCVCYSGQCLFSSFTQNRSANKGKCAQMCRQIYSVDGRESYSLNPKDNNQINRIPELIGSGAKSFKIEGRMKSPQYVAVVVSSYRKAIDRGLGEVERLRLEDVFNRGFVEGYLDSRKRDGLIAYESPKHKGALVGKIISLEKGVARIKLKRSVFVGDGFVVKVGDGEFGFRYRRNCKVGEVIGVKLNVSKGYQDAIVGKEVYRTVSSSVEDFCNGLLRDSKKVKVNICAEFRIGGSFIEFSRKGLVERVEISHVVEALKTETTESAISNAITSFGDDNFVAGDMKIVVSKGLNVSLSEVKKARRELLHRIMVGNRRDNVDVSGWIEDNLVEKDKVSCGKIKMMDYVEGDVIVRGRCIGENGSVVNNLGCLREGVKVIGPHINVFNSVAFDLLNDMFSPDFVILSRELTLYQIRDIIRKSRYSNAGVIVEENTPLMYMEHCVSKDVSGCKDCRDVELVDRIGKVFLIEKKDCVNIVRNADRLDLIDMIPRFQKVGVAAVFSDKRLFGKTEKKTKGHFFKKV